MSKYAELFQRLIHANSNEFALIMDRYERQINGLIPAYFTDEQMEVIEAMLAFVED